MSLKRRKSREAKPKPSSGTTPQVACAAPPNDLLPGWALKAEWIAAGIACLLAIYLNVVLYQHSGSFWRDETNTIQVARAPSLGTMYEWIPKDTAPLLVHGMLRMWIFAGLGATDDGVRLFGSVVAALLMIALVVNGRLLTGRVPLVAISLVLFNLIVFYVGSSIRAYGLSMVLIVPCYVAFWRLAQSPNWRNALASFVFAMLACHSSYLNAHLLLGIGVGTATAAALCGFWRRSLVILSICFFTALSLLPYAPGVLEYEEVCKITKVDFTWGDIFHGLGETFVYHKDKVLLTIWISLIACASLWLFLQLLRRRTEVFRTPSLEIYILIATYLSSASGLWFLHAHAFPTSPWHYTPFVLSFGILVEVASVSFARRGEEAAVRNSIFASPGIWLWGGRLIVACIVIAMSWPQLWSAAHLRRTNMDQVCRVLERGARPHDLILVNEFWLAPSFNYHYRGDVEWNTVPLALSSRDAAVFPYPSMKRAMESEEGIRPTLEKIGETLAAGHRVWVVGSIEVPPDKTLPPTVGPAPDPVYGWDNNTYTKIWSRQVGYYINTRAGMMRPVYVEVPRPVTPMEDVGLLLVEGWRG